MATGFRPPCQQAQQSSPSWLAGGLARPLFSGHGHPGPVVLIESTTYGGEADDKGEAVTEEANEDRGRLRLQWPTFRGSPVRWGIAAAGWLLLAASILLTSVREQGLSWLDALFLAVLLALFAICVMGTVSTIRHPRPTPTAEDHS